MFDRQAFKEALPSVSKVRLTQTLYAEHPSLRPYIEKLEGPEDAPQCRRVLAAVWDVSDGEAEQVADQLVVIGFFEPRLRRLLGAVHVPARPGDGARVSRGRRIGGRRVVSRGNAPSRELRATAVDHLADRYRASPDGGQLFTWVRCRIDLLWIKGAPPARQAGHALRARAHADCRPNPAPGDRPGLRPENPRHEKAARPVLGV